MVQLRMLVNHRHLDAGRKLKAHKTFRSRPERLLNVLVDAATTYFLANVLVFLKLIHDGDPYHIETSLLICNANQ